MKMRRRRPRLALGVAAVAVLALLLAFALADGPRWPGGAPARAAPPPQCGTADNLVEWEAAAVTLEPDSGPPGAPFAVEVTNIAPNIVDQPIEIVWNWDPDAGEGVLVGSGTVLADHTSVILAAVVPEYAEPGSRWVTACWYREASETWFYKSTPFEVTEPTPTPTPAPSPTATPPVTPTATPTPTESPTPAAGRVLNCPQAGKWAIAVWDGPDDTDIGQALNACGEGAVSSAYYIDPESQQWLRWFFDHPDLSNLERANWLLGVIVQGRVVPIPAPTPLPTPTAFPTPTPTPAPTETPLDNNGDCDGDTSLDDDGDTLEDEDGGDCPNFGQIHDCPQPGKWAIAVWDGADDVDAGQALRTCEELSALCQNGLDDDGDTLTDEDPVDGLDNDGDVRVDEDTPEDALVACGGGGVDFAYYIDPESQQWLRWFGGLPEISNFETVKGGQGLIAHGMATLPAPVERIAFVSNRDANDLEIYAVNSDGTGLTNLTKTNGADDEPAWSPDGSKLAFKSYRDGNWEIYVMNADGTAQTRLTNDSAIDEQPVWSPDGSRIAFVSYRSNGSEIWVMNANGSQQTKLTWWGGGGPEDPAWSPDGTKVAFGSWDDIYVVSSDGTGVVTKLTSVGPSLWALEPAWSPDGSRIAYRCCDDDDWEIYVMNADGTAQTNLTNSPGWDSGHAWSPDGTQIAFNSSRDGNDEIYVMKPDGTFPTRLTNTSGAEHNPSWAPDSSRLAVECTIATNSEVCVVDAHGETNVSNHPWVDDEPVWSP